ncbi:MAG: hypothetical protein F4X69_15780 [Gemmatimonadetes bacterium]|nr:hypothetical protein [Gemmatimonadota bacterium]
MSVTRDQLDSAVDRHLWDEIEKLKKKVENLEMHITVDEYGFLQSVSSDLIDKVGEGFVDELRRLGIR